MKSTRKGIQQDNFAGNRLFTNSAFIDLDYDSFDDIAAVDLFTNSIKMFYNDGTGSFSEQRSINLETSISEFRTTDVDLDGFTELTFIKYS